MNDRFKFRIWDKELGEFKTNFSLLSEGNSGETEIIGVIDNNNEYIYEHLVIQQCTGLKDSKGKVFFEGDLFTSSEYPFTDEGKPNYVGEVAWIDEFGNFQYYLHCVNPNKRGISEGINTLLENILHLDDVKIIGNIFENPDLLRRVVNE